MKATYDLLVIGGGSAGFAAARTAVANGLTVLEAEGGEEVGGLCILRGCMPSKALLASANRYGALKHIGEFGIHVTGVGFSSEAIRQRKERLIGEFAAHRRKELESGFFDFVRGRVSFTGQREAIVDLLDGGRRVVNFRCAVIATGSLQGWPGIAGLRQNGVLTSDDLLRTAEVPASVVVLGGGAVALEAAHYYNSMGAKVTLVQRSGRILRKLDADVALVLEKGMAERGIRIITGTKLLGIERDGEARVVRYEKEGQVSEVSGYALFNGLGRVPNTAGLELGKAGVEKGTNGAIIVRPTQQSSVPHIFAAGDVCGPYEVVHMAIQQGEVAARNATRICRGEGEALEEMNYRLKMFAVFTEPQLAVAGYLESEVKNQGIPYISA
ncbi:MAG: NAD(P)/FAD-dependent oxidoreductase, partial [Chthoniobacterales bacterium]|nr:NAD(P)/FAD-dependent oxidoreductase [Chthoniobacterales bacterium]